MQKAASGCSSSYGQHPALCGSSQGTEQAGQGVDGVAWKVVSHHSQMAATCSDFSPGRPGSPWGSPQSQSELLLRGGRDIEVGTRNHPAASPETAGTVLREPWGSLKDGLGAEQSLVKKPCPPPPTVGHAVWAERVGKGSVCQ